MKNLKVRKENNHRKIYNTINRLTNSQSIKKGKIVWSMLPASANEARGESNYYYDKKKCPKGHDSPKRTINRTCCKCENSEESREKRRSYHQNNKEYISKKEKAKYKELTKNNKDSRLNDDKPETRLKKLIKDHNIKKIFKEYIHEIDTDCSSIIENIRNENRYFIGKECKHGHQGLRINIGSKTCYKCKRINGLIYDIKNRSIDSPTRIKKRLSYHKLDEERKSKRIKESSEWNKLNRESHKKSDKKWKQNNPERRKQSVKKDRMSHPARVNAHSAKYRTNKARAMPPWINTNDIKPFYEEASLKSSLQELFEVDHIDPINHKLVCGLHVPWNLQVIQRSSNRPKSNKFTPYRIDDDNNRYELKGEEWEPIHDWMDLIDQIGL